MGTEPRTVAVVGAGITGLTTALTLLDERPSTRVVVLEASNRAGGKIQTGPFAGHAVDTAADAFLARVPDAITLCERLGLADELVTPAERTAYLYSRGALRRFPTGLVLGVPTDLDALAATGVISPEGVARAALDLTMGPEPPAPDESVGSLVRRRLGDEVYEVLVGPLLSGVNAGDADWLSVAAGTPQFAAALRDHDSLIAGARAQLAASAASPAGKDAPVFYGLRGGMQQLVDALVATVTDLGGEIRFDHAVSEVVPAGGRFELGSVTADAVVMCTPLFVTAPLLAPVVPEVAAEMTQVDYASPVMVTLAAPTSSIDRPLDASGFLVASPEGLLLTACSWASSKWAHLDADDTAILRASAGRQHDTRAEELDDDELVDAITHDLATTMDLVGPPTAVRVTRWPAALPQFRPGHLDRVQAWRHALNAVVPGLFVAGAGLEGLGIPACVRQGRAAAKSVLDQRF